MSRKAMPQDVKAAKQRLAETKPSLQIGDEYAGGTITSIKPSLQSGWWLDVRDPEGIVRTVPAPVEEGES